MNINYKVSNEDQLYSIEGESLTLIKASLLVNHGFDKAFHLFQKKLDDNILLYCPHERNRDNLVKRNFNLFVAENQQEIDNCINSIKPIEQ